AVPSHPEARTAGRPDGDARDRRLRHPLSPPLVLADPERPAAPARVPEQPAPGRPHPGSSRPDPGPKRAEARDERPRAGRPDPDHRPAEAAERPSPRDSS